jgi:hypothetical protein
MSAGEEIVALVDENNNVIGGVKRSEMVVALVQRPYFGQRAKNLLHRSTFILIWRSR